MRRREFIILIGGAAANWPLIAQAQAMPTIGVLSAGSPTPYVPYMDAIRKGLSDMGFIEGNNVAIEYRWAEGRLDRLPHLAAELVSRRVALIVTSGEVPPVLAAKAATRTSLSSSPWGMIRFVWVRSQASIVPAGTLLGSHF